MTIRQRHFEEQEYTVRNYIIPFIGIPITPEMNILEVGCGEGGGLKPFLDCGCKVTGVDLSEDKIRYAKEVYHNRKNLILIRGDVFILVNWDIFKSRIQGFDLIIIKDTLEHIHDQDYFMAHIRELLKPGGRIFISFPPWGSPFAGHQQSCRGLLRYLPWIYFLPLKIFTEIKETKLSVRQFKKMTGDFRIDKEAFYLINPGFDYRYGLKPVRSLNVPFFTTTYYCVLK